MGVWKNEYQKNRKRIDIGLNKNEVKLFEKKFGMPPSVKLFKQIVFNKEVVITTKTQDVSKDNMVLQLKKIGNNINQIAWSLNINPDVLSDQQKKMLTYSLAQVNELIQKYEN